MALSFSQPGLLSKKFQGSRATQRSYRGGKELKQQNPNQQQT